MGGILKAFAEAGCTVAGADFDKSCLAAARRLGIDVVEGGTEALVDRPPAELIVLSHVFEHFWDLSRDLGHLRRALNATGLIYVEVPGIFGLRDWRQGDYTQLTQTAHTLHLSLASLTRLMRQYGFELITGDEYIRSLFSPQPETLSEIQLAHLTTLEQSPMIQQAGDTASFRQAYLRSRWESLGLRLGPAAASVALYGAGRHTEYLLDCIRHFPGPVIDVILDDDPVKQGTELSGIPVRRDSDTVWHQSPPGDAPRAIVVSSDNYETQLAAKAEQRYGSRFPVIRLYEGLPLGPYPNAT